MKEWHVIYSGVPSFSILDIVYCTREEAMAMADDADVPASDYAVPCEGSFLHHSEDVAGEYSPAFGSAI